MYHKELSLNADLNVSSEEGRKLICEENMEK
jgi:hypothetical protein